MNITQFVIHNWYLFAAAAAILVMLAVPTINRLIHRVQSVRPNEAVLLINRQDGVVVDVRDSKEFHEGHIVHAVNIPFGELNARMRDLEKYKKRPVIVSCRAGERSAKGAMMLRKQGFENVAVLSGGIDAWLRSQLPVTK